jgi:hypothetical protein
LAKEVEVGSAAVSDSGLAVVTGWGLAAAADSGSVVAVGWGSAAAVGSGSEGDLF